MYFFVVILVLQNRSSCDTLLTLLLVLSSQLDKELLLLG